jgi:endonuclease/exonuclease/phosphatase family metal-dependent hydrolase
LVASAPVTGQNTAILLKPGIEILGFEVDADHFHHAAAIATLSVQGLDSPLTAISVHLCPNGPHVRMREASYLVNHAIDDAYVIIGGDFNSPSPHDEAPDLDALPARFRVRYTDKKGKPHRDVLAGLERAGFVDIGHRLQGHDTATVPGAALKGSEFVPFRCDYFLASRAFGALAESYRVLRDTDALDHASDHYPIMAAFNSPAR